MLLQEALAMNEVVMDTTERSRLPNICLLKSIYLVDSTGHIKCHTIHAVHRAHRHAYQHVASYSKR